MNPMPDALTTMSHLINSPPGQLAAGGVLAGIVWKVSERVEAVLTDQTKLEVAVWLLDRKRLGPIFQNWPETFARAFDRLLFSTLQRFLISGVAVTIVTFLISGLTAREVVLPRSANPGVWLIVAAAILWISVCPVLVSLLMARWVLFRMSRTNSRFQWASLILSHVLLAGAFTLLAIWSSGGGDYSPSEVIHGVASDTTARIWFIFYPSFFPSIWLGVYSGSGFLLKAARRFDIGFDWFNRKFDIEKKPLQSIGLVAGALVAVVYWAAVIVEHILD